MIPWTILKISDPDIEEKIHTSLDKFDVVNINISSAKDFETLVNLNFNPNIQYKIHLIFDIKSNEKHHSCLSRNKVYMDCITFASIESLNYIDCLQQISSKRLRFLAFSENIVESIPSSIEELTFAPRTGTFDIDFLKHFKTLKKLHIAGNHYNLNSIGFLEHIEELELSKVSGTSIKTIHLPRNTHKLSISSTTIEAIGFLSQIPEVQIIRLSSIRKLKDIQAISKCKNLKELHLGPIGTLTDLSPLSALSELDYLLIDKLSAVKDYSFLSTCKGIDKLNLIRLHTGLYDHLKLLFKLPYLKGLSVHFNSIRMNREYDALIREYFMNGENELGHLFRQELID
jgi:hypothetical protein